MNLLALTWDDARGELILLDQRALPNEINYLRYRTLSGVIDAIQTMVVRGAPVIGVAAAYAMALFDPEMDFESQAARLAAARPTAVNLQWAVRRMLPIGANREKLLAEAKRIHAEDTSICRRIGENLLPLIHAGMGVLTHCNAGQLAASRYGTALSPIYLALEQGIPLRVYADETRPRLQGSTLTALELVHAGADVTVLCDNMAASVMAQGKIDCCIVGCDRVAANGDIANKIGTYGVAILAKHFGIPFYVAAPTPTLDMDCPSGDSIPIEERDPSEVSLRFGVRTVPEGAKIHNPAFDVTPHGLITAIVTERGVVYPPFDKSFRAMMATP